MKAICPIPKEPFSDPRELKSERLLIEFNALTHWHEQNCDPYARILKATRQASRDFEDLASIPILPARLFKEVELRSVPSAEIVKTLSSSGTTGQRPSRIFLDKETALDQARALTHIMSSYIGNKRLPMGLVEGDELIANKAAFSARGAGVLGFAQFGRNHVYFLDRELKVNWELVEEFLGKYRDEKVLLFGFTSIIWEHFYHSALRDGRKLDFGDSVLIHGGGWKKLKDKKVSEAEFVARLQDQFGITSVYNYYGLIEQAGSIFMGCEQGCFHTSCYGDVLVRSPRTLDAVAYGELGVLEVMSIIPRSYPGHAILTEDLATILGEDDCPCGRKGKYFVVHGRLPQAELRGCSDTVEVPA